MTSFIWQPGKMIVKQGLEIRIIYGTLKILLFGELHVFGLSLVLLPAVLSSSSPFAA